MENKRLTKGKDKLLCGVCSGLAEYCNIDPTIMRIIWIILTCCYGVGILPYIICALIIPKD